MPRLAELAKRVGGDVVGNGDRPIEGFASLESAGVLDLSLFAEPTYRAAAEASAAGALLVPREPGLELPPGRDLVRVADTRTAMATLLEMLHPVARPEPGVHPTAVVGEGCEIDPSSSVGPYSVIGEGSRIGAGAVIEAHVVIGRACAVGAGSRLHPHVVLYDRTELGERCEIHSGAVLGSDGFGFVAGEDRSPRRVPQVGRVVIGDAVEIGANTTIDRGTLDATSIGAGSKLDNLIHLAHNVRLGRGCLLAAQAGIAGSTRLGDGVVLAGQAGIADHLEVGDGVQVAAKSAVMQSIGPGERVGGIPAGDLGRWRRQVAAQRRLAELLRRVRSLEKRLPEGVGSGEKP